MILWNIPKRTLKKSLNTPCISIDNRGRIHLNSAYLRKCHSMAFEVYIIDNLIHFNHDSNEPDIRISLRAKKIYNKSFADWLRSYAGSVIFPEFNMYGSCTIKMIEVKKIDTIIINGTEYSITGAKNYMNTLKSRIEISKSIKAKENNKRKYEQVLATLKAKFPNEFSKY